MAGTVVKHGGLKFKIMKQADGAKLSPVATLSLTKSNYYHQKKIQIMEFKYSDGKTHNDKVSPFVKEAYQFAERIIALGNRQNPVKDDIAGDWEAGYIFGRIDMKKEVELSWVPITKNQNSLPPECTVVLGYSPKWVNEDFEPEGIRECFYNEEWCSAKWNNDRDCWDADYDTKPTHWMQRPQPPIKAQ